MQTLQKTEKALIGLLLLAQLARPPSLITVIKALYSWRWIDDIRTRITYSSFWGNAALSTAWPLLPETHIQHRVHIQQLSQHRKQRKLTTFIIITLILIDIIIIIIAAQPAKAVASLQSHGHVKQHVSEDQLTISHCPDGLDWAICCRVRPGQRLQSQLGERPNDRSTWRQTAMWRGHDRPVGWQDWVS